MGTLSGENGYYDGDIGIYTEILFTFFTGPKMVWEEIPKRVDFEFRLDFVCLKNINLSHALVSKEVTKMEQNTK